MNSFEQQLQNLVVAFVAEVSVLVRTTALDSVVTAFSVAPKARTADPTAVRPVATIAPKTAKAPARAKGSKRSPEEIEQMTAKLLQEIKKQPGRRIEQIGKAMGAPTSELALPVQKLIAAKKIRTKGERRATIYFPGWRLRGSS